MSQTLLAITTSPRRNGNSETALDTFLSSLPGTIAIEKISLNDITVHPCKGCGFCERTGECIQKDDFIPLSEKIKTCDILVFASPVYSLSVCAQAKALIDRCQVFWAQKYVLHTFKKPVGKCGVFIATAGQNRSDIFDNTLPTARFLFDVAGITAKNTRTLLFSGVDKKTDYKNSPAAIEKTKEAAAALAAELTEKRK